VNDEPTFDAHLLALKICVILLIALFMLGVLWLALYGRESKTPWVAQVSNLLLNLIERFGNG
jgi:hypothetical protein